jgi:malonyl-CoA O-methyltransferase
MSRHAEHKRAWFGKERYLCADMERLPLATQSIDMIVSNLALQWLDDLSAVFTEFQRVLKPDGVLLFATFGPDTLLELRQSWAQVDDHVHVNRFMDMHDVGDAMVRARLADPVMDCEKIVLTYRDVKTLMHELKAIGAHNVNADRPHHLTAPGKLKTMMAAYEHFRRSDGYLPATYEIVYGNAWGSPLLAKPTANAQEFAMPLNQIPIRRKME